MADAALVYAIEEFSIISKYVELFLRWFNEK